MKKKSINDFKKLENKDLKKINGGGKILTCVDGEWIYLEF